MTSDDPRVQQLLDELFDSDGTPEDVCASCPELLPVVRDRWRQVRRLQADLDSLFPESGESPTLAVDAAGLPRIPGYDVEEILGVGGMGVVFRARHLRLNRPVAVKAMLAGPFAGPRERERFQREVEAVAALRHPNVVQVYDVGEVDDRPYFTMEFVEGGSLAQKLAGSPQPALSAAALVATLAAAMQVAHQSGIVHRDLKPSNVLLTADGIPKISDFGLARRLDGNAGLTLSGAPMGTPSYMAPEQARGQAHGIGPATDVYALGAILYELLTGRPPFRAATAAETIQQVLGGDPDLPSRLSSRVPRDLETVCLKCLHKEPRRRYASAAALRADLDRFLAGEAISARPERWLERQVRRARRMPVLTTLLAAGAVLGVAASLACAWYFAERAAAARESQAGWAATERAADEDLREMVRWLNLSSWPEARTALERAKGRLGERGSADLRRRLDQGGHDLELGARLEKIPIDLARDFLTATADEFVRPYEEAFRGAGLGQVTDAPEVVAARIRDSDIRHALVAALDQWSGLTRDPGRLRWVLGVARLADTDPDPTGWRARARDPDVRGNSASIAEAIHNARAADQPVQLLLALDKHLVSNSPERLPFLRRIQQAHPDDFWANLTLGDVLWQVGPTRQPVEAIRYYQAAVALRPQAAVGYGNLGLVLGSVGRTEEGLESYRRAVAVDPASVRTHTALAQALCGWGLYDEAIDHFDAAVRLDPNNAYYRIDLGKCLEFRGRHEEALDQFRLAAALAMQGPIVPKARSELRDALTRRGRGEEARDAWQAVLDAAPQGYDAWYGYAEFCLFLGREDEYRRTRRALIEKFGTTADRSVAARTARACLLLPGTEDELREAAALAKRAAGIASSTKTTNDPFFLFVRGLAEYRQGQLDPAIATMRGEASRMYGPAPRLVLALALHRSGRVEESRRALAAAVLTYDWRTIGQFTIGTPNPDQWIFHVLRREAEATILPDLQAFLDGKHQPRDNDERLALLGVCQFANRSLALARLYTDAFAADPNLAGDFRSSVRFNAARAAALVGSGRGEDVAGLTESERARWRQQARQWLRADLAAWGQALDRDPSADRDFRRKVKMWRADQDLAGFFEPAELDKLLPDERTDCAALSKEFGDLVARAGSMPVRTEQ
jgi:serine/threonine-protein kinase